MLFKPGNLTSDQNCLIRNLEGVLNWTGEGPASAVDRVRWRDP